MREEEGEEEERELSCFRMVLDLIRGAYLDLFFFCIHTYNPLPLFSLLLACTVCLCGSAAISIGILAATHFLAAPRNRA